MAIIQTLPYTPDELAILKEKHGDVFIETIVLSFGLIFLLGLLCIMPGGRRHPSPSLYEIFGFAPCFSVIGISVLLFCVILYYNKKSDVANDIKNGQKTIATIEVWQKIMGIEDYTIFTKEEEPFKSFGVSKEIYHKLRKGNLITVEFAYFTRTVFAVKMPYS